MRTKHTKSAFDEPADNGNNGEVAPRPTDIKWQEYCCHVAAQSHRSGRNTAVDVAAKAALALSVSVCLAPHSDFKTVINSFAEKKWQKSSTRKAAICCAKSSLEGDTQ
jgi:hypothetical protein